MAPPDGNRREKPGQNARRSPAAAGRNTPRGRPPSHPAGYDARLAAAQMIDAVISRGRTLDEAMEAILPHVTLEPRDRAFARLLTATVIRRAGTLETLLSAHLRKTPREGLVWPILLMGAAQLVLLDTPPHAAISLAVDLTATDHKSRHLKGLVNAVLRKVATDGPAAADAINPIDSDIPSWMLARWVKHYGAEAARRIATASLTEASLDLSVRPEANTAELAEALGGRILPTGSIRLQARGPIEDLAGFADGSWWVQDTAATLPLRLFGDVAGRRVADLCAAPGGKSAWLALHGARVTSVDVSATRLERLRSNLARLGLATDVVSADIATWQPETTFDAVLLDAPCTATGTIRRHPDILRIRRAADIARLAATQAGLLDAAARLVAPGGVLVFCTCSLEPEEGPEQTAAFLTRNRVFSRKAVTAGDVAGYSEFVTTDGDLRTLPCHLPGETPTLSGLDGFYAARLVREAD
ncbi:MAG: methyltransferase domain-containing protein [Hyphomicrobiaceae bacterium]|nr:methyltransferase domain-containing protein [Hyphomicrobiaceae bacterium]